jgi:ABC-2 type transport system ATP-binding protein
MIEAHDLSRRYGTFTAVDGISFSVDEGEIVGILGPNGAGKTTIIRMITGFLPPTGGRVTVAGKDLFAEPRRARRDIGYLPENVALYPEMRVREYLAYRARLEGMPRAAARTAIPETLERALLGEVAGQIIGTLSKGFRQRVGLAAAILHQPRVLVLDEPTVGLDPKQIIAIRELIRELGGKQTLLLSTHILPEVELLCDRVLIIDRGRIVGQGTAAELQERWLGRRGLRVELKLDGADAGRMAEVLAGLPGVGAMRRTDAGAAGGPGAPAAPRPPAPPAARAAATAPGPRAPPPPPPPPPPRGGGPPTPPPPPSGPPPPASSSASRSSPPPTPARRSSKPPSTTGGCSSGWPRSEGVSRRCSCG